jgi:endonuclease YncB( thermonuclease family)
MHDVLARAASFGRICPVLVAASLAATELNAQTGANSASGCALEMIGTGKVRRVLDGRTVQLEAGQQLRLAAIEVPPMPLPRETGPQAQAGIAAKTALESLLMGRTVTLKKLGADADRYGRVVAHVFLEGGERSVQHEMLKQGHARMSADVGAPGCAAQMLAAELVARAASIGLWNDPYFAVLRAENPGRILAERGRFALVEGKVISARESRGTIYLNFGRRWSEDFTVTVLKRNERTFTSAGIDLKKFGGRRIRVRGFIEERGGPWIEATRPEQFEFPE